MKVSHWIVLLGIYIAFIVGQVVEKIGTTTAGGILYNWYDPLIFATLFLIPAIMGYGAGREEKEIK